MFLAKQLGEKLWGNMTIQEKEFIWELMFTKKHMP